MGKIKKLIYSSLNLIPARIPIDLLVKITHENLICPTYHLTSEEDVPHIKHLYSIRKVETFKKDLDFFLKNYRPIDLFQLRNGVKEGFNQKYFFLTFDDGLSEIYNVVAPILKEKGIPATFFLNSDFIDNANLFYRYKASLLIDFIGKKALSKEKINRTKKRLEDIGISNKSTKESFLSIRYHQKNVLDEIANDLDYSFNDFLKNKKPYLTSDQINALQNQGFTFGAHSIDHPEYRFISLDEQLRQTRESMYVLKRKFDLDYKAFAFPFTDFGVSEKFFKNIYDKKNNLIDISFGTAGIKSDIISLNIQRIPMERQSLTAETIISSEYLYYILRSIFNKNKIRRN